MVALSQTLPYWAVLRPALLEARAIPYFTRHTFSDLVAATVLTTLGGYLINDLFDIHIDRINKPQKMAIGRWMPVWLGIGLYLAILSASFYFAWRLYQNWPEGNSGKFWVPAIIPATSVLLFLYAWQFKCTPLLGNLIVAGLCALAPAMVIFPEMRAIQLATVERPVLMHQAVSVWWAYGIFAFLSTFFREQVKTLQDVEGDAACGCATLPVRKGRRAAKIPAMATGILLCFLIVLLLLFWQQQQVPLLQIISGVTLLLIPALLATYGTAEAITRREFGRVSTLIKILMATGLIILALPLRTAWLAFFSF